MFKHTSSEVKLNLDRRPSFGEATYLRDLTCPRKKLANGDLVPYSLWEPINPSLGVGVNLYFSTLQRLKWLFLVCGIITLPQLLLSIWSPHATKSDFGVLEVTTLAAMGSK
jgi:hypothetical protein